MAWNCFIAVMNIVLSASFPWVFHVVQYAMEIFAAPKVFWDNKQVSPLGINWASSFYATE